MFQACLGKMIVAVCIKSVGGEKEYQIILTELLRALHHLYLLGRLRVGHRAQRVDEGELAQLPTVREQPKEVERIGALF